MRSGSLYNRNNSIPDWRATPSLTRDENGLHGLVKICVEVTNYPEWIAVDGTHHPEREIILTTSYDSDGRVVSTSSRNPGDSERLTTYTYNSSGLLLRISFAEDGEIHSEQVYEYNDLGILHSITGSQNPDNPITFRFNQSGRKIKIQNSISKTYVPNATASGSPFEIAERAPNLPGGGSSTTFYDEKDRPIEVWVRDAHGVIVNRAVRIYNEEGRIVEEKQILDDLLTLIPKEAKVQILDTPGTSVEDLRAELGIMMAGQDGPYSVSYTYDVQGRVIQTVRRIFDQEDRSNVVYNEHGDIELEITRNSKIGKHKAINPGYCETRYSYKYDHTGNWTEKVSSNHHSPSRIFKPSLRTLRTLTYF